jgi:hypothetical protein
LHEGNVRKARMAEPRPQLEAVLQRLLVVVVGRVLHDNGVVSFADLPLLLGLGLPLLWDLDFLRGWRRLGDELKRPLIRGDQM